MRKRTTFKSVLSLLSHGIYTHSVHTCTLNIYIYISMGPRSTPCGTPPMTAIRSEVCWLNSVARWTPRNRRLGQISCVSLLQNSRPEGFGSPVIVVCDHCWALPWFCFSLSLSRCAQVAIVVMLFPSRNHRQMALRSVWLGLSPYK